MTSPPHLAAPSAAADPPRAGRIEALDGVRGVAALIVVLHHALLASVATLAAITALHPRVDGAVAWTLTRTPFAFVWDGPAAVIVFFVLSGFVLALPHAEGRAAEWPRYYVTRMCRLYLPMWGAILVMVALHALTGWAMGGQGTWWLRAHGAVLSLPDTLNSATLVDPSHLALAGSLWSLRYEVAFSILLPLYIVVGRSSRWRVPLLIGAFTTVAAVAPTSSQAAAALPVFMVGVVMAYERATVARWAAKLGGTRAIVATVVPLAVLLTAHWWAVALPWSTERALMLAGAAGVVALGIGHARTQLLLTRPAVRWLGARSFSLYLVHEPIVTSLGFVLGRTPPVALFIPVALASSLLGAELFWRFVERPSHRFARRAGDEFGARRAGSAPALAEVREDAPEATARAAA